MGCRVWIGCSGDSSLLTVFIHLAIISWVPALDQAFRTLGMRDKISYSSYRE